MTKPRIKFTVESQNAKDQKVFSAIEEGSVFNVWRNYDHDYSSVSARNTTGKKARISKLLLATLCQHPNIVSFLLNYKHDEYDLHHWNEDGQNPLIEAIKSENVAIVKVMAKAMTNSKWSMSHSFKDAKGNTPFHYIGEINNPQVRKAMVTSLIHAGLSIQFENDKGEKPKHFDEMVAIKKASKNRFLGNISNFLFRKTGSFKQEAGYFLGILSLSILALWLNPLYVAFGVGTLLSHFIISHLMTDVDDNRRLALQHTQIDADFINTIQRGKLTSDKLKKYLNQGVMPMCLLATNENGLQLAAKVGNTEQINLLLKNAYSPQITSAIVCQAIEGGHLAAVELLLSKSKALLLNKYASARMLAAAVFHGKQDILAYLLQKGAPIPTDIRWNDTVSGYLFAKGKTKTTTYSLLDFAKDLGKKEIIKLIEDALKAQKVEKSNVVVTQFVSKRQSARLNKNQKIASDVGLIRKQSLRSKK
ncbi:ankyrin repeat domain-containing protein [Candidatus Berkiella aquae]|uniref:Ankyrin repeat domain-containing protein n=1 Tax=Candidatus Berkiella aquae TaxID=295108 RepID=A0A0Q9Z2K7_9GAMM|nr:ankyrin repeat domain-containing protein [Candidatus Berkiella aquae]MCS5711946.1 ankyrin repeat domain-containing protein [Candidatus Berkiella aquae]